MRLLAVLLLSGLAACQSSAPRPEDDRLAALEKQNRGLEERLVRIERDLAEARVLLAQEAATRAVLEAKVNASAAAAASAGPPSRAPTHTPAAATPKPANQEIF